MGILLFKSKDIKHHILSKYCLASRKLSPLFEKVWEATDCKGMYDCFVHNITTYFTIRRMKENMYTSLSYGESVLSFNTLSPDLTC
nr:unnamed protein product [Callosobruchus chinensis]